MFGFPDLKKKRKNVLLPANIIFHLTLCVHSDRSTCKAFCAAQQTKCNPALAMKAAALSNNFSVFSVKISNLLYNLKVVNWGAPSWLRVFSLYCFPQAPAHSKAPDTLKEQVLKGDSIEIQGSDFFTAFVLCVDCKLRSDNICCLRAEDTGEDYPKTAAGEEEVNQSLS